MKQTDLMVLHKAGEIFLDRSIKEDQHKRATALVDTGIACFKEARVIFGALAAKSSILAFIECLDMFKEGNSYPAYLNFCARNGCKMESEAEFNLQSHRHPATSSPPRLGSEKK